jgi:hypothetical protein
MGNFMTFLQIFSGVLMLTVAAGSVWSQAVRTTASPFKPGDIERLRQETADVMSLSEAQTLAAVPEQSGICFTDCPNCDMSTADMGHFAWKPTDPANIVCKDCGAVYPGNSKYPDNQVLDVRSINGTHHYPYYTRPDGYRIYFKAHADFLGRAYMAKACANLAELYWLTKDEQFARRAAIILIRFAQVYPGYALHYDFPDDQKKIAPYDSATLTPQEPPRTAKWSQWAYLDISQELTRAYDILRAWKPFGEMAGGKARQLVERDLLVGMLDYTMAIEESYSNMSPMKWRDAIDAARVTNQPDIVHEVVQRLEKFLNEQFLYDGSWMETSPSYMRQTGGWLEYINVSLTGYEDPPGYANPKTGRHLDAKAIDALRGAAQLALNKLSETRLPDGRFVPVNDTWSDDKWPPRESMTPVLEPGFGIAIMGAGAGEKQYHAYLNFTSGIHHKQYDALSIGLWAHGKELLSDIGYTHTKFRPWATSTTSHNTVVVDGRDQQYDALHSMNRLRAWSTDGKGFHLAEAESAGVYPQTSRYRRTLFAIGRDANDLYLVDVFQVHGGSQHDYILAGSADEDNTAELEGISLRRFDGTLLNKDVTFIPPKNEKDSMDPQFGFGYFHDIKSAAADHVVLNYRLSNTPDIGTRTQLWMGPNSTVYLGEAPSIRRSQGNDSMVDRILMPMLVARRKGATLKSTFIAVHEPVNGSPRLGKVNVLQQDADIVVLQVPNENATDYFFVSLDGPSSTDISTSAGLIHFDGMHGFIRMQDRKVVEAHLVNGSYLKVGDMTLTGVPSQSGEILEAHCMEAEDSRGWVEVNEPLEITSPNCLLLIRYPDGTTQGYEVTRMETQATGPRKIFLGQKPAFRYTENGIELTSFPQRTIEGKRAMYDLVQSQHYQYQEFDSTLLRP